MTKGTTFTIILFAAVLAGFYFLFSEVGSLRNDVRNLELALEISKKGDEVVGEAAPDENVPPEAQDGRISVIPTAIIFDTLSSPILEPQTKVTVTVESISKTEDGTVGIHIRAFTSEANAYSALQPQNFFELIDLEAGGQNLKPIETIGSFSSIPPKSAASGRVNFKIDPGYNSIILQINYDGVIKYYELDFGRKTYKETAIG